MGYRGGKSAENMEETMLAEKPSRCAILLFTLVLALTFSVFLKSPAETTSANLDGHMMMEHIDMECETCHGKGGPKKMMKEHEGIPCLTCHGALLSGKVKPVKEPVRAKTSLKNSMMMEHIGMDCSTCHGKSGPKGMMEEHEGIECSTCHPME